MDINKIEKHIQALIDSGKIKNYEELKDIPIDKVYDKLNICPKELLCYYCQKENLGKCDNPKCNK
jgi:hypothetical protein